MSFLFFHDHWHMPFFSHFHAHDTPLQDHQAPAQLPLINTRGSQGKWVVWGWSETDAHVAVLGRGSDHGRKGHLTWPTL